MKHRRHPNFPSYRFYSDHRIMNKTTNRFIKVKPHMKLIDAEGKRKSITSDKLFSQLFPNLYSWEPYKALRTKAIIPKRGLKGNILMLSLIRLKKRQIRKPMMNLLGSIIYQWVL